MAEVTALIADTNALTLQLRLIDKLGDNGVIAIVVACAQGTDEMAIDTWLMSCRVLGRQVEAATLNLLVEQARHRGARWLAGTYIPTTKNGMVRDHYSKLGFVADKTFADGTTTWRLDLDLFEPIATEIKIRQADPA